ncbi:MAG TPA: BON domain-containing protein [Alphaproteobacteria bacterium]|nr:BON domain-containing protein [Alphaproteobacteria bacterium]
MSRFVTGRAAVRSLRRQLRIWGALLLASLGPALALSSCSTPALIASGGATVGVAVSQERGAAAALSDNTIAVEINQRWLSYDWHIFSGVSTAVSEGRVMLTGKVARDEDRDAAVKLVRQVPGVRDVYDDIIVTQDGGAIDFARDTWISTQLKTDLTFDDKVRAINYDIVTVDGTVYMLGIAQNQDEIDRIMRYARNVRYVRDVVTHIILKDDPSRHAEAQQ